MSIKPIVMSGAISRVQDMSTIKQNEDNKGLVDQKNFQTQFSKEIDHHVKQVNTTDKSENKEYRYDAKEKGNGNFYDGQKKKREQEKKEEKDKVRVKNQGGFDIRI